ncbi:uncharacterized protein LOC134266916 [Saccostrea cucullata]|uniref:uncharacterized protein LOC134266916 n=1 Tax=Saccostrea cuccullata TaxID=36930 RepID=UPI002ED00F57
MTSIKCLNLLPWYSLLFLVNKKAHGACKTYFISLRDSERRKQNGRDKDHATRSRRQSRRRERARKLKRTLTNISRDKLGDFDRSKLMEVMTPEYLSSEESEEDEGGNFLHFKVRRLPWQRETFQRLKDKLEEAHKESLTPQHKRQLKKRVIDEDFSSRTAPDDCPKFVKD